MKINQLNIKHEVVHPVWKHNILNHRGDKQTQNLYLISCSVYFTSHVRVVYVRIWVGGLGQYEKLYLFCFPIKKKWLSKTDTTSTCNLLQVWSPYRPTLVPRCSTWRICLFRFCVDGFILVFMLFCICCDFIWYCSSVTLADLARHVYGCRFEVLFILFACHDLVFIANGGGSSFNTPRLTDL